MKFQISVQKENCKILLRGLHSSIILLFTQIWYFGNSSFAAKSSRFKYERSFIFAVPYSCRNMYQAFTHSIRYAGLKRRLSNKVTEYAGMEIIKCGHYSSTPPKA
jgi:hypothetical protein